MVTRIALRSSHLSPRTAFPAVLALALAPWILYCARSYPDHALYFDHSMYQYTAWCIRHGERLYRDVAVPDGPFITWLHALVQIFAGESDRAFRWADLVIQTGGAVAIGAVVAPYRGRAAWACAIAALWLAQYFHYDWHWTAQRESYYALCGYLGMALMLLATRRRGRAATALAIAGGALAGATMFGKHVGVIFVVLGLVPAILGPREGRARRVLLPLAGVALAIAAGLVLLALTGSIRGFAFWYLVVPRPYRYIMGSADFWPLLAAIDRHTTLLAAAALVTGAIAAWRGWLPRRYLGFAVAPLAFLVAMVLQRKGHIYQSHPITAGTYLFFAIFALHLSRARRHLAAAALVAALGIDAMYGLATSSWIDPDPPTATSQLGAPHVDHADMAAAAAKVAEITKPSDRVLAYGPAGRLLYLAGRRPAIAPFTNFFFDLKRAVVIDLAPDRRELVDDVQSQIAARSCPRLRVAPAAAVVCNGADWAGPDGIADVIDICPNAAYLRDYTLVGVYGCWHVLARSPTDK